MSANSTIDQIDEQQSHSSMMAWRVHEFGPPNVMRFERVLRPNPGPDEILVKVEAAGVGQWDGWIRVERARCRNRSPLLWARICLVKPSPWVRGF
jgi:hypothetical protein